ncbi:MAG: M56 family metallopeptidase [Nannocystaceae bacterium]
MTLAPALVALAWTLLHTLWEAALIAGVVALVARRTGRAELRYALYFVGALACVAAGIVTYAVVYPWTATDGVREAALVAAAALEGGRAQLPGAAVAGERWLAGVLLLWSAGASLMTARTLVGLAALARLRRRARPLSDTWSALVDRLRGELGVRRSVAVAESREVDSPLVIGALRPLILLPVGMVTGLSPASVEAALLHELVHVRRHDYLMGLGLALAEALLFFHPAIWWLSRRARAEREHCCDDGVVRHTGDALRYALALTDLEAYRARAGRPPRRTLSLGQAATGGDLMSRIHRLIEHTQARPEAAPRRAVGWLTPALTLAAALAVAAFAGPACLDDAEAERSEARSDDAALELAEPDASAAEGAGAAVSIAWLPPRFEPLLPEIEAAATRHAIDPELLAIVALLESGGDPLARSPSGARGLMQLMPETAAKIAARRGLGEHSEARLDDPAYNLDLGAYHLAELIDDFAAEEREALSPAAVERVAAAYNGGAARARAYLAGDEALSEETSRYKGLIAALWSERAAPRSQTLAAMRSR